MIPATSPAHKEIAMPSPASYAVEGRLGILRIDNPPVNAMGHAVRVGLDDALRTAADDASQAVLILCEGRTFVAGADITEFGKPPQAPWLPELYATLENLAKPVVSAIHGTALGGGFELALASHYRVAVAGAKVGLPEVKLGLLPGAGGTQRLPRIVGVPTAVQMMTSGAPIPVEQAEAAGVIDAVFADELEANARAFCEAVIDDARGVRRTSELTVPAISDDEIDALREQVSKQARGQTAPLEIMACAAAAATTPFNEGAAFERDAFLRCMQGEQSAGLRHMFFAEREAAKVIGLDRATPVRDISRVGIIGGGTMGGGIAMSFANAGFDVTLVEVDDAGLERGLGIIDKNYAITVGKGKLSEAAAAERRGRIGGTTNFDDLADVDLVIEAVFENLDLKQEIFAKLDGVARPGAILATNTSYQDVDQIAAVTNRPEDVLGLHFFSPANVMKLLEVVHGEKTADDVLATCMTLAKRVRKVPVLSGVCYGFIGNRMLQYYGREAQLCLIEGSSPAAIDGVLEGFGMAMGPLAVFDLAGLDIGYKARQSLPPEERGDDTVNRVADVLVESGRLGQKTGAGFYRYDAETRRRESDPDVQAMVENAAADLGVARRELSDTEIRERLLFALINEGMNILDEGIAQRPGDIDVVYVYGYGFPAYRGGPMFYADTIGLPVVLERIRNFAESLGTDNWTPSPLLQRLVDEGVSLKDWAGARAAG
ncbi:MAG: 3-hydroxyacyl-CoA dehydrogenase NAD-binding domain-containing protein [Pseudomonadota bacterium]